MTNSNCHCDQILVIFNKNFGNATNSNCHRDQTLIIFTKNFGNFYQKLVTMTIGIGRMTNFG